MSETIRTAYYSNDPFKMSSHYHDCHQIIFVLDGKLKVTVNGASYTAKSGSIALFSRYEDHSIEVLTTQYGRYVLRINPQLNSNQCKLYSLLSNRPQGFGNVFDLSDDKAELKNLFERMVKELNSSDPFAEDMLELLLNQLLIIMYRHTPDSYFYIEEEAFELVCNLQKRFETDYSSHYTLELLAREYGVSPSSLSHQFKRITGSSVMGYLNSCRLASAKNYLSKTKMSVGEIVDLCGFSDSSNFSRTFKKLNGMSPSQFREKYRV